MGRVAGGAIVNHEPMDWPQAFAIAAVMAGAVAIVWSLVWGLVWLLLWVSAEDDE